MTLSRKINPYSYGFRRSKYGNVQVSKDESFDGRHYHSRGEHARARDLSILEKAGQISDLRYQVKFSLEVLGEHICNYIADFVYQEGGATVVEDFKGVETDDFKIKWALMKAIYPANRYLLTGRKMASPRRKKVS